MTLTYVMGGISKTTKKPYLQVSDGVTAEFVNIPPTLEVTAETFSGFKRGAQIELEVEVDPFAQRIVLLEVPTS